MNIRTALAVVAFMELLTLTALGYYSSQAFFPPASHCHDQCSQPAIQPYAPFLWSNLSLSMTPENSSI